MESMYLLMQVGQLVIMAQAGLWVPAERMRLQPCDTILTRMGAHDSILQGRSTFLEELQDASHMLASATPLSLVIVDELGRGTATHDGVAIAASTLEFLVRRTKCCALFVTHYPEVCSSCPQMEVASTRPCDAGGYCRSAKQQSIYNRMRPAFTWRTRPHAVGSWSMRWMRLLLHLKVIARGAMA
jgi:hypothetical protein